VKYTRPRGTQDIGPPEIEVWRWVERVFDETFERYGYQIIRTPIFESTELFVRAVGEGTDIVSKEMYTFADRRGRSLTLRPENTASVIRAYLEAGMHRLGGVQRLCYTGPMFRYDRPQAGRYRQFHQVGAEAIGSDSPALDVEMIQLVMDAFAELGFEGVDLRLNSVGTESSRGPYREVLRSALEAKGDPALSRYLQNPLRVFDAKDVDDRVKRSLPTISSYLTPDDAGHFERVKDLLARTGVSFTEDRHLVRGLDYYTKTVFEVYYGARGAQSALCGGGRYDDLVEEFGGPATPAIGFSAGLERIVAALPRGKGEAVDRGPRIRYYVACIGTGAEARALAAARVLRRFGGAQVDLSGRSRKKQVQAAEKSPARFAVIVDEADAESTTWRDLAGRSETSVADADLESFAGRTAEGTEP